MFEFAIMNRKLPSCIYRLSRYRRPDGKLEYTVAFVQARSWMEEPVGKALRLDPEFCERFRGEPKKAIADIDYYTAHGITTKEAKSQVCQALEVMTQLRGNGSTPVQDLAELVQMVLKLKEIADSETGTSYEVINPCDEVFANKGTVIAFTHSRDIRAFVSN